MSTRSFATLASTALTLALAAPAHAQAVPHFIAPQTYAGNAVDGPSIYWSAAGDFNGDGYTDLAAPDIRSLNNILGFSVAFGRADHGFDAPVTRSVGSSIRALRAGDFNHDGRADLLLVTMGGALVVQGNADGTFSTPVVVGTALIPNDATLADFNGDGNLDVVFSGDLGYSVALGTGLGTFGGAKLLPESAATFGAVVGDFNHDGALDFTGMGGIFGHTYLGNGDGSFRAPIDAGVAAQTGTVSGDFNGDGIIDMIMTNATPRQDGSNYGFKIAVGFGDGTFSAYISYVLSQQPISNLAAGDFNADGITDLAVQYNGSLHVMAGDPLRWIAGDLYSGYAPGGMLFAADLDANGSSDLVAARTTDFTVLRDTHGNPPLLAQVTLSPAFTIGGVAASGIVQLGGVAPAGGAVVTLTSSNPALASFPASVTVAEGASSAAFDIATSPVAAAGSVTVGAAWNGVAQSAALSVLPAYTLTGFSINPGSQYGIFTVRGTLTLSNPADTSAVVQLVSANPALASVPAAVTVPAGATSVDFTITLSAASVDTPVTITASRGDVTMTASVTVLKPADTIAITRAQLTQKTSDLRIEATSTSATTTLTAYNAATGALLGTLDNAGGGKYKGAFVLFVPANAAAPTIVLKSALGGTTSGVVQLK